MSRDLNLKVLLALADKVSEPLKRISGGSKRMGEQFKAARDNLKKLEAQQKDISSFKALRRESISSAAAFKAQQDRVRALANQIASAEKPSKKLSAEFKRAQAEALRLKERHKANEQALHQLRARLTSAGISTRNLGQHERQLRQNITSANAAIQQQQQRLQRLTKIQQRNQQVNQRHGRTMTHAAMIGGAGYASMAVGRNVLNKGATLLEPGINFGAQMSELQAIARLDKTSEAFQRLKKQARDLGATTAFTAAEVGGGQTFLARAGFSADAIQASMPDMLAMAIANNTELARTADIASNIAGAFKIDPEVAGNMTRVADVLSGTAARANVNLEMLGETMKYLGGAEDLKLTLEQAAAMTGLMGNIGIQGSMAGTAMRAMMTRLTAPAKLGRKAMAQINLQVKDANGNLRAMPEILRDINNATKKLGNVERKKILQHIFGAEAGSGMAELVSQMATGGLDKLLGELQNLQGENAKMAATMADNVAGDLKGLRSAWEDVGITITDTNEGPLRDLVQQVTGIIRGVGNWIKQNPQLTATIAKVVAVIGILAAVGGTLLITLASIIGPISMLSYGFTKLRLGIMAATTLLSSTGTAVLPMLIAKFSAFGAAIMATPVGWIIAGIAAIALAGALIYKYWGPIKAFFTGVWMGFTDAIGPALVAFRSAMDTLWQFSPIRILFQAIGSAIGWVWNGLKSLFAPVQSAAGGFEQATSAGRAFGQFLGNLVMFFPNLISGFVDLGARLVDGLVNGIKNKFTAVKDAITGLGTSAIGWFKDKLGIHSPSRVFATLGDNTMAGLAMGLNRSQSAPMAAVKSMAGQLAKTGIVTAGLTLGTGALAVDSRPPLAPQRAPVVMQGDTITININAPQGADANAIARAVAHALEERSHQKARRGRSTLYDNE